MIEHLLDGDLNELNALEDLAKQDVCIHATLQRHFDDTAALCMSGVLVMLAITNDRPRVPILQFLDLTVSTTKDSPTGPHIQKGWLNPNGDTGLNPYTYQFRFTKAVIEKYLDMVNNGLGKFFIFKSLFR